MRGKRTRPVVYYRPGITEAEEEQAILQSGINHVTDLSELTSDDVVVGRYSLQPFFQDISAYLKEQDIDLLLPPHELAIINDAKKWADILGDLTIPVWTLKEAQSSGHQGGFIVKGQVNSRKHEWSDSFFAKDITDAEAIVAKLKSDPLFVNQEIILRPYRPLKTYFTSKSGLPIADEYRFFILDGKVIDGGFYWADSVKEIGHTPDKNKVPQDWLDKAVSKLSPHVSWYVVDVAQTQDGDWTVIELNDPTMSGLGTIDPVEFYTKLKAYFSR